SFVERLQFLETLVFADIRMRQLPAEMSVTPLDKREPLEPLNSSLQTLSLVFDGRSKAHDTVAVTQYLLMRLPNLIMLSVPGVPVQPVLGFAREYSRFYSHLKHAES
ncbi:hypothetical protein H4R21_006796, partial [Coemansia helicoidea]